MKAIVQEGHGSPDVLRLRDIDTPAIGDDGVLVGVRAASVNAGDWHMLSTLPRPIGWLMSRSGTVIPGWDLAGQVEAVGRNVTQVRPGDEVFGTGKGTFAELSPTTAERLAPKPRDLTFEQAAALPVAGFTALQGLRDVARVQPGQHVLIYGAGGGVGTFAVQIAKSLGAHVTAVTRTENLELLRSLGTNEVIDYTREDCAAGPARYDVFFDVGANRAFKDCLRVLRPGGKIVVAGAPRRLGAVLSRMIEGQLRSRLRRQPIISFLARVRQADLIALKDLVEAGKLSPVIGRRHTLGEVPEALRLVGTGSARGKLVISIR